MRDISASATEQDLSRAAARENPLLLSGLALAGANLSGAELGGTEDGILTAVEIASLDLSAAQWAVLSGCETALGDIRLGEGVLGLRRSFHVAGAKSLIMSLWPVDDRATRRWMRELYLAKWEVGMTTAAAVRSASVAMLAELRRRGESDHPFYWGAWVAAGDSR